MLAFIKYGHVFIVGTGLILFWAPLLSSKGGRFHRRAGKLYIAFMSVAGMSGAWLAANYFRNPAKRIDGVFLLYALFVYFSVGWNGLRALKAKGEPRPLRERADLAVDGACIAGGLLALALGLRVHDDYLIGIGPLGMLAGARHLRLLYKEGLPANWWLREHLAGMIGTGIAGYTALIFFELSRYLPAWLGLSGDLAVWLAPAVLGSLAIGFFFRRYPARATAG